MTITNKCTSFASHFDIHADQALQRRVHPPWLQIKGYPRCHQTPPLGKYLPRIAPADVMVIDFGSKKWVVALWNHCFEASIQKAWNRPSTQLIKATSCIERLNATIQAEELSYLSSHQTLTADKNLRRYHTHTKLIMSWWSWPAIAVKLLISPNFLIWKMPFEGVPQVWHSPLHSRYYIYLLDPFLMKRGHYLLQWP